MGGLTKVKKMLANKFVVNSPTPYLPSMFGLLGLDSGNPESAISLGEAILAAQKGRRTIPGVPHIQHYAGPSVEGNWAFMFGVHPEQPAVVAPYNLSVAFMVS